LFYGQYHNQFKENNRLEIPANFRELLAGRVVITQGFDRNILALSLEAFEDLSRLVMALNITDPLARGLMRMLLGNASFLEIDQSGAISLKGSLKEYAGLDSEVVLVGQGKYFELWSRAVWHEQEIDLQDAEANSQRFASINLGGL
jgi:MraZ protein